MTQETRTECPSCSPEEKVPHEILKLGINPLVLCQKCGLVYVPQNLETPEKISVKVFVNRIERPFRRWIKLDAGEVLYENDEIILNPATGDQASPIVITSLQVGVRRVPSAKAEELDTIWARPLDEIPFARNRKVGQKHPMSLAKSETVIGISGPAKGIGAVQES